MELSPALKVLLPDPYVYRGRLKRSLAAALDWLGDLWLAPEPQVIDWKSLRRVAVLRLDHMGDVLNLLPALASLKKSLPGAVIDLYVGPWGREIAELGAAADRIIVVEAPWFARPLRSAWPLGALGALSRRLREGDYDLGIDFRGELRHMLSLWLSGTRLRLGHTLSAGRFFLTHAYPVKNSEHERERNASLLTRAGLELKSGAFKLRLPTSARSEAGRLVKELKVPRRFVAVQAACGTAAKRWMPERWARLIDGLSLPVVLLGSQAELEEMRAIAALCKKRPRVAAGRLSLAGLGSFLEKAALLISVDSGPAHLAAALGRPVLALYAATNLPGQWAPQGRRVRLIQKQVPCGPCELQQCPYGNECMRRISPEEALRAARPLLGARS
jgi:ADP-heptose:LPS heptosyltransferase